MIKIVKTWCENTKEGRSYLRYTHYGIAIRIPYTNYFLCIGAKNAIRLNDVKIIF